LRHSPRGYSRTDRIADQLQRDLASLLHRELKDPRLGMVTVSSVKVSRDLAFADVYVSFMGLDDDVQIKEGLSVLSNAAGYLRSMLAKGLKLRVIPQLRFYFDHTLIDGPKMSGLINKAISEDEERAKKRDLRDAGVDEGSD